MRCLKNPSPACGALRLALRREGGGTRSLRGRLNSAANPGIPLLDPPPQAGEEKTNAKQAAVGAADEGALAALVDRLGNRLGLANLCRLAPYESHLPERAVAVLPAF